MNGQSVKESIALAVDQSELNIDPELQIPILVGRIVSRLLALEKTK
jgi:hypothetical protein